MQNTDTKNYSFWLKYNCQLQCVPASSRARLPAHADAIDEEPETTGSSRIMTCSNNTDNKQSTETTMNKRPTGNSSLTTASLTELVIRSNVRVYRCKWQPVSSTNCHPTESIITPNTYQSKTGCLTDQQIWFPGVSGRNFISRSVKGDNLWKSIPVSQHTDTENFVEIILPTLN